MFIIGSSLKGLFVSLGALACAGAASASCLSGVPDACNSGVYNPDVVIDFYKGIYAQSFSPEYGGIDPGDGESATCIAICDAAFRAHVNACMSIDTSEGTVSRELCLQTAETALSQCYLRCVNDPS